MDSRAEHSAAKFSTTLRALETEAVSKLRLDQYPELFKAMSTMPVLPLQDHFLPQLHAAWVESV